mgnify:FL=1
MSVSIKTRLRDMGTPAYQMIRGGDEHLRLEAETFAREAWHWGEAFALVGLYVGPRVVWAAFQHVDHGDSLAKATFTRAEFEAWRR